MASIPDQLAYCITSPPYWDMLRMRGAQTQKRRREDGLDVHYSEDEQDLGNVQEYSAFLDLLVEVYRAVSKKLRRGAYLTVIVKNVKKKGVVYPLAWDLAMRLSAFLAVCDERFWCQDDIRLAPYGYGNAWVSNTFHHYCLNFVRV